MLAIVGTLYIFKSNAICSNTWIPELLQDSDAPERFNTQHIPLRWSLVSDSNEKFSAIDCTVYN